MPFQLTNGTLRDQNFLTALAKVRSFPHFKDKQAAYNIARICRQLPALVEAAHAAHYALVNDFAMKDEAGNIVPKDGQEGTFQIEDVKVPAFEAALKALVESPVTIESNPVYLVDLGDCPLSPQDLDALAAMVTPDDKPKKLVLA